MSSYLVYCLQSYIKVSRIVFRSWITRYSHRKVKEITRIFKEISRLLSKRNKKHFENKIATNKEKRLMEFLQDIKNSVRILSRRNSFQFRYSSSKFSTSFTSMDKLCEFIFKSFGKDFPKHVITNDHIDEVNDIQDNDVMDPVDPNIINDIIRTVKCIRLG